MAEKDSASGDLQSFFSAARDGGGVPDLEGGTLKIRLLVAFAILVASTAGITAGWTATAGWT